MTHGSRKEKRAFGGRRAALLVSKIMNMVTVTTLLITLIGGIVPLRDCVTESGYTHAPVFMVLGNVNVSCEL